MSSKEQARGKDRAKSKQPQHPTTENLAAQERPRTADLMRRAGLDPESLTRNEVLQLQRAVGNRAVGRLLAGTANRQPMRKTENKTGLPDDLKAGVERLSGLSLDDIRVHYNAPEPARYQALAYTRGAHIHVGPGYERHLAHEAWHVVQQKQGRVRPTAEINGAHVNDQESLEHEADAFGSLAARGGRYTAAAPDDGDAETAARTPHGGSTPASEGVMQLVGNWEIRDQPGEIDNDTVVQDVYSQRKLNRKPTRQEASVARAAYVANIPAVASGGLNLATGATKYRNEGFANPNDADLRLAMVFGVNRYRDAQGLNEGIMDTARNNFAAHLGNFNHFPVAAISFLWEPSWTQNNLGRTMAQVRHAFDQGGQGALDIAETQRLKFLPGAAQRVVPYGEIRDKIKASEATAAFQDHLRKYWREVFVHTGDADVTSLHVTTAAPGAHQFTEVANTGLFDFVDQKLGARFAAARLAAQADTRHANKTKKAEARKYFKERLEYHMARQTPDVMTGGYDFRLPGGSSAANTSIDSYITMLASRLDFTVRAAMMTLDARTIYFPEPNTFYNATAYLAGSFGSGHEEGQQMMTSLLAARVVDPNKIGLYQGAAVGTDPTRFSVGLGDAMVNTQALSTANIAALFNLAQSHARRNTWADRVEAVATRYGDAIATGPLQALYDSAFPQRMTDGSAGAIDGVTNDAIDTSVNTYLARQPVIYSTGAQRDFLGGIAKASGKAALAFLKSLIASWPGA